MLIVALVLAVVGLAALVTAVVTSNEMIAWVCIAASVIGVVLLIVDALRERSRGADEDDRSADHAVHDDSDDTGADETTVMPVVEEPEAEYYPDEPLEPETETGSTHKTVSTEKAVSVEKADDGAEAKRD